MHSIQLKSIKFITKDLYHSNRFRRPPILFVYNDREEVSSQACNYYLLCNRDDYRLLARWSWDGSLRFAFPDHRNNTSRTAWVLQLTGCGGRGRRTARWSDFHCTPPRWDAWVSCSWNRLHMSCSVRTAIGNRCHFVSRYHEVWSEIIKCTICFAIYLIEQI